MVTIDPQQELFTKILKDLSALGFDVYDGFLPPEDTPYPFVYLGEVQQLKIKIACRSIDHTPNFAWSVVHLSQRIITDTTTAAPLLHGVLDVEFKFS